MGWKKENDQFQLRKEVILIVTIIAVGVFLTFQLGPRCTPELTLETQCFVSKREIIIGDVSVPVSPLFTYRLSIRYLLILIVPHSSPV